MVLEDETAAIYGCGAIGGAVGRAFADAGARVHLAGRSRARLERVARDIGDAAVVTEVDPLDGGAVADHADVVAADAGGIDIALDAARTRLGVPRIVFAPGRPDVVREIDSVVAGYFSLSWAAPHLFGDERDRLQTELRALLRRRAPDGLFWDWPGDTELVIATRPT